MRILFPSNQTCEYDMEDEYYSDERGYNEDENI